MPEIIVEYIPDFSKLQSGMEQLVASGAVSQEFAKDMRQAQKPVDDLTKKVKQSTQSQTKDFDMLSKRLDNMSKEIATGFKDGIVAGLKQVNDTLQTTKKRTEETTQAQRTLKAELKELVQQLALMKVNGEQNTAQYKEMSARAGELRDTLDDVNQEIRRLGSDTRTIDTVIESIQGLAAAGQIAAGVSALMGQDDKELQEILVRLNATMAIANGIQQIANLLQKESNLMRAIGTIQTRAQVAATNLETAAQSRNIVVKGAATVAMRALNLVMNANPALLLVSAFAALAGAIAYFSSKTEEAVEDTELLNAQLNYQKSLLDSQVAEINKQTQLRLAASKARGESEEKQNEITINGYRDVAKAATTFTNERIRQLKDLKEVQNVYIRSADDAQQALLKVETIVSQQGGFEKLDDVGKARITAVRTLVGEIISGYGKIQTAQNQVETTNAEFIASQYEKARQRAKEAEDRRLADRKAAVERQLLTVKEGSQKEINLRKDLINAERDIELNNEKLTNNQRLLIIEAALKKRADLDVEFNKKRVAEALKAQAELVQAELDSMNLNAGLREDLSVMLLNTQRQAEIAEIKNNAAAVAAINAKYDKQIAETRLQIRREALEKDLELTQTNEAARVRALQRELADEKTTLARRLQIIQQIGEIDLKVIERRKQALEQYHNEGIISEQEYQLELAKLKDEEKQVHERVEQQKTDTTKAEDDKRLDHAKKTIDEINQHVSEVVEVLSQLAKAISDREQQRVEVELEGLQALRDAGAITEREFIARSKRLESEQKNQQIRAARREKTLNIFNAAINGATAIIKAAPNPFLIAFTAALVAAQIAAIIAQPLPRFGKGTKSAPRGFAEVGETGPEVIQTSRGYYLAEHPQIVWLKGGERIYNPHETKQMTTPAGDLSSINYDRRSRGRSGSTVINYEQLGKSIGNEIARHPRLVVNLDQYGFDIYQQNRGSKQTYLNKRHTYNA